jgi:Cu(I)/Ag(I) efflux system membrane fusion protein
MQLVPVYADQSGAAGAVKINSNVMQNLGIRLGKVEKSVVQSRLAAVGSVAFDEHRVELVQARVTGNVTRLLVKAALDQVHRGQALAEIISPEWQQAEQEYSALLGDSSDYAVAIRIAARHRLLLLGVPESTVAELERTGTPRPTTLIFAPIDGVVTELGIREGASFSPGMTLFRINGLRSVWVNAQVPEVQRYLIHLGSITTAHATGWPGMTFSGRVDAVLPQVDSTSRTLTVRAALDNPGAKLSPGMFVTLDLLGPPSQAQLVVPSEAIITTGQRKVVILAHDDGSFDVVNVTTASESDGKTVIISGLTPGQSIVLSGQFLIDSEASLTATVDRLGAVEPATATQP